VYFLIVVLLSAHLSLPSNSENGYGSVPPLLRLMRVTPHYVGISDKNMYNKYGPITEEGASAAQKRRLEFVHITKTGGSTIEKVGHDLGIIWGACHFINVPLVGCMAPDLPYQAPNYQSYALTSPWHTPPKLLKRYADTTLYPYDEADLFTVIRNPYSRVLSEYYCPWTGFQAKYFKGTKHEKDPNDPDVMNQWVVNMVTRLSNAIEQFKNSTGDGVWKKQAKGVNEDERILAQKHYVNQVEYVYDGDNVLVKNIIYYENLSSDFDALMKKYNINASLPSKDIMGVYKDEMNKGRLSHNDLYPETIALINEYAKPDFEKFGYKMVNRFVDGEYYSLEANINKSSLI